MSIDVHCLANADDIIVRKFSIFRTFFLYLLFQIHAAAYSKVDGVFNPFVRPEPIHICKVHEHEDPLVQFMHDEILKFGNVTKVNLKNVNFQELSYSKQIFQQACPIVKGQYYYMHNFVIDETKFPMPLPEGEFRLDVNASVVEGGNEIHAYNSEVFFRTVKS